jgi:hypothetical protein
MRYDTKIITVNRLHIRRDDLATNDASPNANNVTATPASAPPEPASVCHPPHVDPQ